MSGISSEELARAEKVLESVRDEWLERDGVTAVDLGFKWEGGQMTDRLSIRIHVAKKKLIAELDRADLFPEEIDGLLVDVIEATYAPQALVDVKPEAAVEGRGRRWDVIPLGVSIGSKYSTAGTLGAKVIDNETGDEMILSNWHVLAGRRDVQAGLPIWQPGWIDGGTKQENVIAELTRWILGPYDAAVARITGERPVQSTTIEGKDIDDRTAPKLGMLVWKSGRSTGLTRGFVDGIRMMVAMNYQAMGVHMLQEVIRIVPRPGGIGGEISIGGDSGSVWVDEDSGKAVGLHFAGEIGNSPEHALAHDIAVVFEALQVSFQSEPPPVKEPPVKDPPQPEPPDPDPDPPQRPPQPPAPRPAPGPGQRSFWDDFALFLNRILGGRK